MVLEIVSLKVFSFSDYNHSNILIIVIIKVVTVFIVAVVCVISITDYFLTTIITISHQIQALCDCVAKTKTMSACQVVKTEEGQEIVLSFGRGPHTGHALGVDAKENRTHTLKYLDEDDAVPDFTVSAKVQTQTHIYIYIYICIYINK